jgi:hypothetical protein
VTRSRSAWLVYLPLLAAGCLASHWVAYAVSGDRHPGSFLAGHGDLALALAGAVLLAGLVAQALDGRTARVRLPVAAALPPATFTLQEHLERAFHGDGSPWGTALEPAFLIGLALQAPFVLAALALARALSSLAGAAGRALTRPATARPRPVAVLPRPASARTVRSAPGVAHAGRGPPALAVPA